MKAKEPTLIVTFANTPDAIAMETFCKQNDLPGRLIPIPGALKAGCGLAWKAPADQEALFTEKMNAAGTKYASIQVIEL
ncbi:MAG: DUF3343 domain-containing protein [Clostridia bacterium]|nr:DUF3343 domain-containing protein [Clostridia bacterium]